MSFPFTTATADSKRLSRIFRLHRDELIRLLFNAIRDKSSATWIRPQEFDEVEPWGLGQLLTAVDLFEKWLETRDPLFQELFDGWTRSWMVSRLSGEGIPLNYDPAQVIRNVKGTWMKVLQPYCRAPEIEILQRDLNDAVSRLSKRPLKRLNVLLIGDCIQFETISALLGASSQAQLGISPVALNAKVQPSLRNSIRSFQPDQFDLIFFSPFSHSFLNEYAVMLDPRSVLWAKTRLKTHMAQMLNEISLTLETLVSHFECNIYVHNTAGTIQSFGLWSGLAKHALSYRNRKFARRTINQAMSQLLSEPRLGAGARIHLVDENSLAEECSGYALATVWFKSYAFHPTRLGLELGRRFYYEAAYVNAFLSDKKVLVCDLDDTLWDGVIGEGPVTHFIERQELLLGLKKRGVLLSINSKNESQNIIWTGAALTLEDFVAPQINWESKAVNIARIRDELNLNPKDFVYLDNRPDELERVQNAFPDTLVLDSTKPFTWRCLSHWLKVLAPSQTEDRTRLYREKSRRSEFLNRNSAEPRVVEDETAALRALDLLVNIRQARPADFKRATELINRTNQFNLCGSRTTPGELQHGSPARSILVAEGGDKFGSMGIIGVMVADCNPDRIEIPIFVLSCRAFGFGFEYALLNTVKQLQPAARLLGHYKETPFNERCRNLYPNSGLSWDGRCWAGRASDLPPDPVWLTIRRQISAE